AIAGMRLGRVDAETTANLSVLNGGLATNIVPSQVVVRGETRSLSETKLQAQTDHMRARFQEAAARHMVTLEGREYRARVDAKGERQYEGLNIAYEAVIVKLVSDAARTLGRVCPTRATGGGSDANVFITRGIEVANLACGMRDIHSVNECVDVKDLVGAAAQRRWPCRGSSAWRAPPSSCSPRFPSLSPQVPRRPTRRLRA